MGTRRYKDAPLFEEVERLHSENYYGVSTDIYAYAQSLYVESVYGRMEWRMLEEILTVDGWQVDRHYIADYRKDKDGTMNLSRVFLAFEYWEKPTEARGVLMGGSVFPYYCHSVKLPFYERQRLMVCKGYTVYGDMLNGKYSGTYVAEDWYDGWQTEKIPGAVLLPDYERMGVREMLYAAGGGDLHEVIKSLRAYPILETIAKTRMADGNLLGAFFTAGHSLVQRTWHSIVVANRHGYLDGRDQAWVIDYLHYIDLLASSGRDARSPHYLDPDNMGRVTAEIQNERERQAARAEREKMERQIIEDAEMEKSYRMGRSMYFGLFLESEDYYAVPLKSIRDFAVEGSAMHHCVFKGKYYNLKSHPDSLILSVRNRKTGKREVTIEYDLKTERIKQCYAVCDSIHDNDKGIRAFIMEHSEDIRACRYCKSA